jgi:hypothetical protein
MVEHQDRGSPQRNISIGPKTAVGQKPLLPRCKIDDRSSSTSGHAARNRPIVV